MSSLMSSNDTGMAARKMRQTGTRASQKTIMEVADKLTFKNGSLPRNTNMQSWSNSTGVIKTTPTSSSK